MIENKSYSDEEIDALMNSTYDPKQHGLNLNWSLVIFSAIFFFPITIAYINSKLTPEFLFHKLKSPKWRNKLITFLKKESCVSYDYKHNQAYIRHQRYFTPGTPEYRQRQRLLS